MPRVPVESSQGEITHGTPARLFNQCMYAVRQADGNAFSPAAAIATVVAVNGGRIWWSKCSGE